MKTSNCIPFKVGRVEFLKHSVDKFKMISYKYLKLQYYRRELYNLLFNKIYQKITML